MPGSTAALVHGNRGGRWLPKTRETALDRPDTAPGVTDGRRLALVEIEERPDELDEDVTPVEFVVGPEAVLVIVALWAHRHRDVELLPEGTSISEARVIALREVAG